MANTVFSAYGTEAVADHDNNNNNNNYNNNIEDHDYGKTVHFDGRYRP